MSHYPPTPQRKACDCSDPCISTDDVYYAGPNLPNSGVNTSDLLTEVIEKLDAIYAVPTLQKVTEMGNVTTLPIIADSFVKIGGDGNNILLDNGSTVALSSIGGEQDLQQVTDLGASTTNTIAISPIGNNIGLLVEALGNQPAILADSVSSDAIQGFSFNSSGVYAYSQIASGLWAESRDNIPIRTFGNGIATPSVEVNLGNTNRGLVINSGASSTGNFIELDKNGVDKLVVNQQGELTATKLIKQGGTSSQFLMADGSVSTAIPFSPSDYDLDEFTNNNVDPFVKMSDIAKPYKVYTALLKRTGATVNPPIVLENTIGTITLTYDAIGIYSLNSSGLFTLDKTVVFVTNQPNGMFGVVLNASRINSDLVQIIQTTDTYTNDNDWIAPVSIEIRVYN